MTPYMLVKWLLVLLFIPLAYILLRLAQRRLSEVHPIRQFLQRHGVNKVAWYGLLTVYVVGGILLTVIHS